MILLTQTGCGSIGYLIQAGRGQLQLSNRARPISEVLHDETTPPRDRALLAEIPRIKAFGEKYGLKPTSNYQDYVKLDRPAAVWVVSASDPLSFEPKKWSWPIVGSFTYLGWFDLEGAKEHAELLRDENLDVDVRGATAFSTLGWFRDPILSTMISKGQEALGNLVNVILHESVHTTLYVNDQSYFNESIASFVADRLTPIYLKESRGEKAPETAAYLEAEKQGEKRQRALHDAYRRLAALYASDLSRDEKVKEKKAVLAKLEKDLQARRPINNATLIQYRTYGVGMPEYEVLLRECGKNWGRFWAALDHLKSDAFKKPHEENLASVILPIAREGCPKAPAKIKLTST